MSTNELITQLSKDKTDIEMLNDDIDLTPSYRKHKEKLHWYYVPAFLLFWLVLLFAVVIPPFFFNLPTGLKLEHEASHPNEFIAERAQRILLDLERIGPKIAGSNANENITVQLLLDEVEKIRSVMLHDIYDLEIDVQVVSGSYIHWHMINMYQDVQNVVVKLSTRNSTSQSYILINSHFNSKPGSPGTGDAGAMVVVMLETIRVLASSPQTFIHPIVFLFNGACLGQMANLVLVKSYSSRQQIASCYLDHKPFKNVFFPYVGIS